MEDDFTAITHKHISTVIKAMINNNVDYVIFGAIALAIHGIPRSTMDIDIFVRNSETNIKNFIDALLETDYFPEVTKEELIHLQAEGAFEDGVIKFGGDIGLDVATTMGERNIDTLEWETKAFGDLLVNVITIKQLYEMKSTSYREKDLLDAARISDAKRVDLI